MNCEQFQMLIFDRVDGTLGRRQQALVDAHLAQCGDCRDYLRDEQAMRRVFPGVLAERENELTLSPAVRRKAISAVQPARTILRPWFGIPRWEWALAAGLALLIIPASLYLAVGARGHRLAGKGRPAPAVESFCVLTRGTDGNGAISPGLVLEEMRKEFEARKHDFDGGTCYSPMRARNLKAGMGTRWPGGDWPGKVNEDGIDRGDNSDSTESNNRPGLA